MHQRIFKYSLSLTFIFFLSFCSFGQSYWHFQNDNDLYFSKDYYYSNGLFLNYGSVSKEDKNLSYHFELGQEIYNPSFRYLTDTKSYDYPYSGYLYLKSKRIKTQSDRSSELSLSIGISGDASQAKQLQNWYHNTFLGLDNLAWVDAMPQKFLIDLSYSYTREWTLEKDLKFAMETGAQLGLVKTYLQHRAFLLLNGMSVLSVNNPLNQNRQSGFLIGVQQQYFFHDFMIQGPLDNSNAFERELEPYRITFMAGPVFYINNWAVKAIWNYRSKDNSSQRHPWHPYMSIGITKLML